MTNESNDQGQTQGNRSVVVGRDVINSIINTGDHNQFFMGDYERLRDAYIEPWSVFERVNLGHFVGREWLLAEVDAFLRDHDRGYFILEAEAGLGKTTFLAWLTRKRGYIHYFTELAPGLDGVGTGLKNLAAQLVLAYHLSIYEAEGVLPGAATRPDYLLKILKQAAEQRPEGEKLVLVVDALDEAGTPHNQNVLGLPSLLPEGVYIIVSHRPVPVTLRLETPLTPRYLFRLTATSHENQTDMHRFLERAATWPGIVQTLHESGYTSEQFVAALLEKCRGVWIYLHYVVHEIERGERSPLALEALPNGMTQYYARSWQHWRNQDEASWDALYLPLLTTLAAAQEAIPVPRLAEWAGVQESEPRFLRRLLNERWRPFLTLDDQGEQTRYRFYHATLHEFFTGQVERETLTEAEKGLVEELAEATRQAHHCLAERYLRAWGGFESSLTGLQEPAQREIDEEYGLRHLVTHLVGAGRATDLDRLLRLEWVYEEEVPYARPGLEGWLDRLVGRRRVRQRRRYENAWYSARERAGQTDGYLADVTRAWRLAEAEFAHPHTLSSIGRQCRYALITTSLNSLAQNISPALLIALVTHRVWTPAQALVYIRQSPDSPQQVRLTELAFHLPEELARETLAAVKAIEPERFRAKTLTKLLSHLPEGLLWEALAAARAIKRERSRAKALVGLASHLPEGLLWEALAAARAIKDAYDRAWALTELAPHLPETARAQALQEALAAARAIEWEKIRAEALVGLASHLPEGLLWEALAAARAIKDADARAKVLAGLAPHLPETVRAQVLQEALAAAWAIKWEKTRAEALAGLAPHLPEAARAQVLQEALAAAWAIKWERAQAEALVGLAPHLPERLLGEALAAVRAIGDANVRGGALAELAPFLPKAARAQAWQEALALARAIKDVDDRAEVLAELAPHLPEAARAQVLQEALAAVQAIGDANKRAWALAGLAPHLPEAARAQALQEALAAVRAIENTDFRAEVLVELAPHLPEGLLGEALAAARAIKNADTRAKALAGLTPRLAEAGHLQEALAATRALVNERHRIATVLIGLPPRLAEAGHPQEALAAAWAIKSEWFRAEALAGLARHLPEGLLGETLAAARAIKNADARAKALAELAPHLPEAAHAQALQEALAAARAIRDASDRAKALAELAPRLPEAAHAQALQEALAAARAIKDASDRAEALVGLAPHLPEAARAQVLLEALAAARAIKRERSRARALAELAPHLPEWLLGETLAAARAIKDADARAQALAGLTPHLPEAARAQALQEALATARAIGDADDRAEALAGLAARLAEAGHPQEALAAARTIEDTDFRAEALAGLAPHLPEGLLGEALAAAWAIKDADARAKALAELAPHLPEGLLGETLAAARAIESEDARAKALVGLVPHLTQLPKVTLASLWQETLPLLATRRTRKVLVADLNALGPVIAAMGGAEAVGETFRAIQDVGRWWP